MCVCMCVYMHVDIDIQADIYRCRYVLRRHVTPRERADKNVKERGRERKIYSQRNQLISCVCVCVCVCVCACVCVCVCSGEVIHADILTGPDGRSKVCSM